MAIAGIPSNPRIFNRKLYRLNSGAFLQLCYLLVTYLEIHEIRSTAGTAKYLSRHMSFLPLDTKDLKKTHIDFEIPTL